MATTESHAIEHPHLDNRLDGESTDIAGDSEMLANEMSGLSIAERYQPRRLPRPDVSHYVSSPRGISPTGSVRSSYTTRRRVSRTSWGAGGGGFSFGHRSELSKELTSQAEGEFFALTELMTNMSRRSLSLREVWSKIIAERDAAYAEMDRMSMRFEELTEVIEQKEKEHEHHNHGHEERKQEIAKVRFDLAAAITLNADFKKKLKESDTDRNTLRHAIAETKDILTYTLKERDELQKSSDQTRLTLVATESARADLDDQLGKLRGEREALQLQFTDLHTRHEEFTSNFESISNELLQHKHSNTLLKKEKQDLIHKNGGLEDSLRKVEHRHDEIKRKYKDLEELHEKKKHEVKELNETVSRIKNEKEEAIIKIRHEKEEVEQHIEKLKREIAEEHDRFEDAEDRCGQWKLKSEQLDRELVSAREEISSIEFTKNKLNETITKKSEELSVLSIEKKRIQDECDRATGRAVDNHRQLLLVRETLSQTESLLKKKEEEIHTKTERIERLDLDYGHAKSQVEKLEMDMQTQQSLVASLKIEVQDLSGQCQGLKDKCHEWERKCEDAYETITTEIEEGNSSYYASELSSMRAHLHEVREQKEAAIMARNEAERLHNLAQVQLDQKRREYDSLHESTSAQIQELLESKQRSGSKTITTKRTRMSTSHGMGSNSGSCSSTEDS